MKKFLLFLGLTVFAASGFAQDKQNGLICAKNDNAQKSTQSEWAMVTDFTATDLDGTEHNLQTYLDAGKYVIVDASATWCGPCWSLHQSGVFDELHNTYGPAGTDELVVLWVEIDPNTTLADIQGTGSSTQGDWTEGGTWPVPIIDDSSVGASFSELATGYVPEVYLVCPSGAYKIVTDEAWTSAEAVYGTITSCPTTADAPIADFSGTTSGFMNTDFSFTDESFSIAEITGWSWTFESGTPATSTEQNPTAQWATAGTYNVTLEVTNAGGSSSVTKSVTVIDPGAADDYHVTFEECLDFETDFTPYGWTTLDVDATATWGWNGFDYPGETEPLPFIVWNNSAAGDPAGMEVFDGDKAACAFASNGAVNDDWLISPMLTIGDNFGMKFMAKSYIDTYGLERIKVGVSTTDNQPASFTFISAGSYEEVPTTYTEFSYDLSAYAGQDVYVAIQCVSNDASLLLIDNIDIQSTVSIEEEAVNFGVYPNPSNGLVNISNAENASVKVLNNVGQVIISRDNISNLESFDMSKFESGSYIINIELGNKTYNKHLVLTK